eukprot:TRINITY_DN1024_c0_g1_i5.p1 TRINITY_DN1024_c0_g1~~TRINITY_DN1024_c0_g1_i5.p1  ORF type:complete len:590 (-),score=199.74 TRINITY_DN1024_c0_g1_i5:176-1945(-)
MASTSELLRAVCDDDDSSAEKVVESIKVAEEDLDILAKSVKGLCVECTDQPASKFCESCQDEFCDVCYEAQHKRGNRRNHVNRPISISVDRIPPRAPPPDPERKEEMEDEDAPSESAAVPAQEDMGDFFYERAKYLPLRLSLEERKLVRLLEAALNVSEYTDKIDIYSSTQKSKRIMAQLREVCAILSGLAVATDYQAGQALIRDKEFKQFPGFFQRIFELGRRHKIRNPEKMRDAYGKMVYLLQDSQIPEIQQLLEFSLVEPVHTVYWRLEQAGALDLLRDPVLSQATVNITAEGKTRARIDKEIKNKEKAVELLARKYTKPDLSYDEVKNCIASIGDNQSYLLFNRDPVDKMIEYLTTFFKPDTYEPEYSLAIVSGRAGARLTHSHTAQYYYVLQSLTLWREILHDMFKLWYLAEEDLLDGHNPYRLTDTGQGLNRVQNCPRISRAMFSILSGCQRKVGHWVGSSVVHLGDRNVPNALMFIDKYNQVSRILNPIVICLRRLDEIYAKPDIKLYIDSCFGGPTKCKKDILIDFFRHAFDGSGADNFFEAGSCIDGRLTSAWNWCSLVEKKPYYPVFLLTGFVGFDGQF